jgi:hypothetical protein
MKIIWKKEKSLNLRNALKISFLYLGPYPNNFEKDFYQKFAKTITCGAKVVQSYNHINITHMHLKPLSF